METDLNIIKSGNEYNVVETERVLSEQLESNQVHLPISKVISMLGYLQASGLNLEDIKTKRNALNLNDLLIAELNKFRYLEGLTYQEYLYRYENNENLKQLVPVVIKGYQYGIYDIDQVTFVFDLISIKVRGINKTEINEDETARYPMDETSIYVEDNRYEDTISNSEVYQEEIKMIKRLIEEFLNNFN